MSKKKPFVFNNSAQMHKAKAAFEEKFPQLTTSCTESTLFVDVRNSLMFELHIQEFFRKFGGIPRPDDM